MPKPSNDTRRAIFALPGRSTDRGRCVALGLPLSWRGTLNRIANDFPVSLDKENEVRLRLGLPALVPPLVPVPPCPDCGSVHHARCNGNGGQVVVLAPGETVRRPRGPWVSKAKPEVAAMVRGLELCLERKAGRVPVKGGA